MRKIILSGLVAAASLAGFSTHVQAADATLKIAMPTIASDFLHYYAVQKGTFKKHNIDLTVLDNTAANTASLVVSGQADIALFSSSVPLLVAGQGKATSIIYGIGGGGLGGAVLGDGKKVKVLEDLKTVSPCRIASFPTGTVAYGYAAYYKSMMQLNCDILPFTDPPSQIGALLSGRADAIVGAYSNFVSTLAEGKAVLVLDTRDDAQRAKYVGQEYPESVMWGLSDTLKAKPDVIATYLKVLDETFKEVMAMPEAQVADVLANVAVYKGRTAEQIRTDVAAQKAYMTKGSTRGYISKAQWDLALQRLTLWGVPGYDPAQPRNAYEQRIDMSYYEKGVGKP